MKIALTGGSGYVGNHLILDLLSKNYEINALTRSSKDNSNPKLTWYKGDINDKNALKLFLDGCDVVCNCAGEISNPLSFQATNTEGVKVLYEASIDMGIKLFIHLSSAGIYSVSDKGEINEDSPISSSNSYEKSKIDAEEFLFSRNSIKTIILRPTTVYGHDMPNNSIRALFKTLFAGRFFFIGSKKSVSCYISHNNLISAIARVIEQHNMFLAEEITNEAFNLSDDLYYIDFLSIVARELKLTLPNFRLPLSLVLIILLVNKHTLNINLPLTTMRAKILGRKSSFTSQKFKDYFNWNHPYPHSKTIKRCIKAWF